MGRIACKPVRLLLQFLNVGTTTLQRSREEGSGKRPSQLINNSARSWSNRSKEHSPAKLGRCSYCSSEIRAERGCAPHSSCHTVRRTSRGPPSVVDPTQLFPFFLFFSASTRASSVSCAPARYRDPKGAKACPLLLAARVTAITKARARAIPSNRPTRSSSSRAVSAVVAARNNRGEAGGSSLGLGLGLAAGPSERSAPSVRTCFPRQGDMGRSARRPRLSGMVVRANSSNMTPISRSTMATLTIRGCTNTDKSTLAAGRCRGSRWSSLSL